MSVGTVYSSIHSLSSTGDEDDDGPPPEGWARGLGDRVDWASRVHGKRGAVAVVRVPGMGRMAERWPGAARAAMRSLLERLRAWGGEFAILDGEWTLAVWAPVSDSVGFTGFFDQACASVNVRGWRRPVCSIEWVEGGGSVAGWKAYRDVIRASTGARAA